MNPFVSQLIDLGMAEDFGLGDLTSELCFDQKTLAKGVIRSKQKMIVCGVDVAREVFHKVDPTTSCKILISDGTEVELLTPLLEVSGSARSLLKSERLALNFLQRLSGIATHANQYAKLVKDFPVRVCDTRKTIPGYRYLEKYAVKCGGCHNHRFSLSETLMLKNNHLSLFSSVAEAVNTIRKQIPHTSKIEVEVRSQAQLLEAIDAGADVVLLDNMNAMQIAECVQLAGTRTTLEASGGVRLENIVDYAKTGVHVISCGDLTHGAKSCDIHMLIHYDT